MGANNSKTEQTVDQKIISRLSSCYKDNAQTFSILLIILGEEEKSCGRDQAPTWIYFRTVFSVNLPDKQLIEITETRINHLLATNEKVLQYFLTVTCSVTKRESHETDEKWLEKCTKIVATSKEKAVEVWEYVPVKIKEKVFIYLSDLKEKLLGGNVMVAIKENPKLGTIIAFAAVAAIPPIYYICKWYNKEISGEECICEITNIAAAAAGGIGGGYAGAVVAAAAFTNPVAGAICIGVSCIITAIISFLVSSRVMNSILKLPPTEALKKAYKFMQINYTETNEQIHAAIVRKFVETRPKNDGDRSEEFEKTQLYSAIIMIDRGWKPNALAIEGPK